MKAGKLSEAVEKRSVLRPLMAKGKEPAGVAACGQQAAEGEELRMATGECVIEYDSQIGFLVQRVVTLLAAERAEVTAAIGTLLLPAESEESELKKIIRDIREALALYHAEPVTVQTRVSRCVAKPVLSLTMTGRVDAKEVLQQAEYKECLTSGGCAGKSIIMAGYAAAEATVYMLDARKEELLKRLSEQYLTGGRELLLQADPVQVIQIASEEKALVKIAGDGGVFTALWELGEYLDCGMQVQLREIPLRQETIEICEILDLNPYQMRAGGAILVVTEKPEELLEKYRMAGILAAEIGFLCEGADRVLLNGEEQRFLEPFREDELYKAGILN